GGLGFRHGGAAVWPDGHRAGVGKIETLAELWGREREKRINDLNK
ncbi:hypothetical protein A2U01_0075123, partial [Trifolium medium]|nr:hypothetical protein [Trifolium medium]